MKQVKINGVYNKKLTRDVYGKFSPSKFKERMKVLRNIVIVAALVLVGITYTSFKVSRATSIQSENFEAKVEALKDKLVEDIRNCERSIYNESDAPIILDTNKKMSIGTFMYQKTTVQHYYKTLYGQKITPKEATLIALDENKARELTYDIIFKDSKGIANWHNCAVKVGGYDRVKLIKELQ